MIASYNISSGAGHIKATRTSSDNSRLCLDQKAAQKHGLLFHFLAAALLETAHMVFCCGQLR